MRRFLKYIYFLWMIFSSVQVNAQFNWLSSAGGNGNEEILKNRIDGAGNIYSVGYFSLSAKFGTTTLQSAGSGDILITKQDITGDYLWAVKAGGPQSDRGNSISIDPSGIIWITGYFTGQVTFGTFTLTSLNSSQDLFVAKMDAAGNFLWAKNFGGNDIDLANAIQADASGNAIITGQFRDSAWFDSFVISSAMNPLNNAPSFDIFIVKVDTAGNVLWLKQGSAKYDDRGIALSSDADRNIYVSGQFSDTLHFDNTYLNNGYNASFLMKLDSMGNEIWFKKLFATQVLVNDLKCKGDKIFVTGDFQGVLSVIGSPTVQLTNPLQYKIFLLRFDTAGNVIFKHADGSDNFITSLAIEAGNNGKVFCAGMFKCVFTDYSATPGTGIFNSVGFRDVFISMYDSSLERKNSRQYAGPHDDFCSALSLYNGSNPVIGGSFERNFNVPEGSNFIINPTNHDYTGAGPMQLGILCNDPWYGSYVSVSAIGNKDIFTAMPFDTARLEYDFYDRIQNLCIRDTLFPGINFDADSVFGCDSIRLFITTRTGSPGVIGPDYSFLWSNGSTLDSIFVKSSGWYAVNFSYKDECRIFNDSIYVQLFPSPSAPIITTSNGIITKAIPVNTCFDKLVIHFPDTTILSISNVPSGYTCLWNTPVGSVQNDSVQAFLSGYYEAIIIAPGGLCSSESCIELFYYDTLNGNCLPINFTPKIFFIDSIFEATDTVSVCRGDPFSFILSDSVNYSNNISVIIPTFVNWSIVGDYHFLFPYSYETTFMVHLQTAFADSSGDCIIQASILDPFTNLPFLQVNRSFYLNVLTTPNPVVVFNGPSPVCPDDTVMLTLSGGDNYQCTGPGIVSVSTAQDTLWVNKKGLYYATYLVTDPITGCSDSGTVSFDLTLIPAPLITLFPTNGYICPNDSVLLTAEPGSIYIWYGPLGNVIGNTQSIYVSTPGLYYYTLTTFGGCTLISETKEVKGYTTPFILADPGPVLCPGGSVAIQIYTIDSSMIQWASPLSGNNTLQVVNTPGIYSCSITSCSITTQVDIEIKLSTLVAEILPQGPFTICQGSILTLQANPGMVTYSWNAGQGNSNFYNASTAGIYSVVITDVNGCTAMDSIQIDTFPLTPPPVVQNVKICSGDSVILSSSASGYISWYDNANGFNVLDTGITYTTPALTATTIYYVSNHDANCESDLVPLQVKINPASLLPNILADSFVCSGATATLIAPYYTGVNYSWTGPNSLTSTQQNISISNFDSTNVGYYTLQLSDAQCVSPVATVFIGLYQFAPAILSSNSPVCEFDSLSISVNSIPNANYQWTGPGGFTSNQQLLIFNMVQLNQSGLYTLVITENGCLGNPNPITVMVNPQPSLPVISGITNYCEGDTVQLSTTIQNGVSYSWTLPNGFQQAGTNLNSIIANGQMNGYFLLNATLNGCSSMDSVMIQVAPQPPHVISVNSPGCEGDTLTLSTINTPGATYNWNGPAGFSSINDSNVLIGIDTTNAGYYSLQVGFNGCFSDRDSMFVAVNTYPVFTLMGDTTICDGTTFTASVPDIYGNYNWNNSGQLNTFQISDSGYVTLAISNNGCITSHSFYVNVIDCSFAFPNVFTPNMDGVNDYFEIIFHNAQNISLKIYNRWGQLLKESNGTTARWDGKSTSGEALPDGTYLYTVKVVDYFGGEVVKQGTIQLIR